MRLTRPAVILAVLVTGIVLSSALAGTTGKKATRPRPRDYGNVLIDNYSTISNRVAPVVFKHWLHRSMYTCRLCHLDIGFAMIAGETDIRCDDNREGLYCGACHNGTEAFARSERQPGGGEVFHCERCHSQGRDVSFKNDFRAFRRKMPRERFGNGINWLKAEEDGLVTLKDTLPGVTIPRKSRLQDPAELQVATGEGVMPDIIFSHKKHAVWSGCELCHPELFGVKAGDTVYSMKDIFDGLYCGVCHGIVAFPNNDCQRCHTTDVY